MNTLHMIARYIRRHKDMFIIIGFSLYAAVILFFSFFPLTFPVDVYLFVYRTFFFLLLIVEGLFFYYIFLKLKFVWRKKRILICVLLIIGLVIFYFFIQYMQVMNIELIAESLA